jgi:hypothetical protein
MQTQPPRRRPDTAIEPQGRPQDDPPLPQGVQNRPHDRRTSSPDVNQSPDEVEADDSIEGEGSPGLTIGGGGHA